MKAILAIAALVAAAPLAARSPTPDATAEAQYGMAVAVRACRYWLPGPGPLWWSLPCL